MGTVIFTTEAQRHREIWPSPRLPLEGMLEHGGNPLCLCASVVKMEVP